MELDESICSYEEISPLDITEWDTIIQGYKSKYLFQEACWLRFLQQSQGARIQGLKLLNGEGAVVGYFCAGQVQKGPFRLLGSPLQGWTTGYMGPIINEVSMESFLKTLEKYYVACGVDYVELSNPNLPASAMRSAGYEPDPGKAFLVTIDDEAAMWKRLDNSSCRYCIRRAVKNGMRVERATDRSFVQQYYAQLEDVFLQQGLVPTYGVDRVQSLWDALMPAGKLLALRVWHDNEIVATGLFPFDDGAIYFWGGASSVRDRWLAPNELLQWHVMLFALERGIPIYDMGGGGTFKKKFGGTETLVERWFKTLSPTARVSRWAYKHYFRTRQRFLGQLKSMCKTPAYPGAVGK